MSSSRFADATNISFGSVQTATTKAADTMRAKAVQAAEKKLAPVTQAAATITNMTNNTQGAYRDEGLRSRPVIAPPGPPVSDTYRNEGHWVKKPDAASESERPTNPPDESQFGYKVRLFAVRNFPAEHVIFETTPAFSESRAVEYNPVAPVHLPGSIQVYKRTGSRTFSVGAKFVSRNMTQATDNMKYLQTLRGWCMPYFGIANSTTDQTDTNSMLGAPPDVLYLYAYSSSAGSTSRTGEQVNIKKVPVVITNLSITYPDDIDYIPTATGEPFPIKMDVTVELLETHSPTEYEKFSLADFKSGKLIHF